MSIVFNAGLLVALLASKSRGKTHDSQPKPALAETNTAKTYVVVRKQFFTWQELESPDYPAYVKNLRDIGCPEQTVRDIIIADIGQMFAKRRAVEVPTPDQEWWRTPPDANFLQMAQAKSESLEQERRALLTTLLGTNWNAAENELQTTVSLNGPVLGELPPETKALVQDIVGRALVKSRDYSNAQRDAGKSPDVAELTRINQQMRSDLARVLTPPQLEEFLLRYSQNAASLRTQMAGIDLSPEEFRQLFRASDPIEQQIQLASGDDQSRASQQSALAKQLVEAIKGVLGPDRYQAYRMAQDPLFADAVNQATEAGAPPQTATALYQLNKIIAQERNRILNDTTLSPDQRAAQLRSLDQQQQNTSDQVLGITPTPPPPLPTAPTPAAPLETHAYSPGETLDQIAAQYGVTSAAIINANPGLNFNNLNRGTPINVPNRQ